MYSTCGLVTKNNERMQQFKGAGDSRYIYQNKLERACFQYDMAYGDFKDLSRSLLCDKAVNVAKNLKYNGYQRGIASMVFKFLDKKSAMDNIYGDATKIKIMPNQQLAEELHKPTIKIYKMQVIHFFQL